MEFFDVVAKSLSGKIVRRLLRDSDAEKRANAKPQYSDRWIHEMNAFPVDYKSSTQPRSSPNSV
jgi:hypothetical protein